MNKPMSHQDFPTVFRATTCKSPRRRPAQRIGESPKHIMQESRQHHYVSRLIPIAPADLRHRVGPSHIAGEIVGTVVALDLAFSERGFKLESLQARDLRGSADGHSAALVKCGIA